MKPNPLFAVWATDDQDALAAREDVREQHRARLRNPAPHAVQVVLAGPTFEDGKMNGTLLVVQATDIDTVRGFIDDDPYVLNGIYRSVEVRPWVCGLGTLTTNVRDKQ
jgi:uncharacterized protein YciI